MGKGVHRIFAIHIAPKSGTLPRGNETKKEDRTAGVTRQTNV